MHHGINQVLYGGGNLSTRARIKCIVKSTFSETILCPALNDLLISNPSPAAVSRFRMGRLEPVDAAKTAPFRDGGEYNLEMMTEKANHFGNDYRHFSPQPQSPVATGSSRAHVTQYGTVTRFGGRTYDVQSSINVWSSGMWVSTSTGSTAAIKAAGGSVMDLDSNELQYLIREHMIESDAEEDVRKAGHAFLNQEEQLHLRWNSHKGRIFIDGSHLTHDLELGDEVLINAKAPPLQLFLRDKQDVHTDSIGLSKA